MDRCRPRCGRSVPARPGPPSVRATTATIDAKGGRGDGGDGGALVWYASYGSNLCRARFLTYLAGGTPPGGTRAQRGARDPSPPRADVALTAPHRVVFASASVRWDGGGVAFLDPAPSPSATARLRAWLITRQQFEDVVAQESGRPTVPVDLEAAAGAGRLLLGPGRYDLLVVLGHRDGRPVVTFTAPVAPGPADLRSPSPAYLRLLAAGLVEAHGLTPAQAGAELAALPGAAGRWTAEEVAALLGGPVGRP